MEQAPDNIPVAVVQNTTVARATHPSRENRSAFLPVLLLALGFLAWSGFQTVVLTRESDSFKAMAATQDKSLQDAFKLRNALDALARDTRKLSDAGNAGARLIVDELRKRGVTISTDVASPPVGQASK